MHSESPKPITIAVPIGSLQAAGSPAVARAARAVTERLVRDASLRVLAVSDPIFHYGEIVFQAWDLSPWLASHRLTAAQPPSAAAEVPVDSSGAAQDWGDASKRLLGRFGLRRPVKRAYEAIRSGASAGKRVLARLADVGLRMPARQARRVIRGGGGEGAEARIQPSLRLRRQQEEHPGPERCVEQASTFVSMRDLDALISFDCCDAVWDWPTEFYDCKPIGFFHDAIPLRMADVPDRDRGLFFRSVAKLVNRADCIVCGSKSAESDLHTFFPQARAKTRVVYLGHDVERFAMDDGFGAAPNSLSSTPVGHQRACAKDPHQVAMLWEPERRKNVCEVLRACRRLAALRPGERISLTLIGRTSEANPYEWLAREAARYVDVNHLGQVAEDRLGEVLRSCDVFVYPSLWEGFGTPVLEAMTAGVPVVCAENSSLTEIGGPHAFYCDPYDAASIASAVSRALSLTSHERAQWLAEARRWAGQFTWERTAEHLIELIHERAASARPATAWGPLRSAPTLSHVA